MRPARLLRFTSLILLALGSMSCADVGNRPAVKVGNDVITLGELRRQSADLPPSNRPTLATRAERLSFVDDVIRRRLLLDHARKEFADRGAGADSTADRMSTRDQEDIVLRRLQAIEGGMGDPTEAELREAQENASFRYRMRRILFGNLEEAQKAAALWQSGAPVDTLGGSGAFRILEPEERDWSVWPIDAATDAIVALDPGECTPALSIDGQALVIQLLGKTARDPEKTGTLSAIAEGVRRRKRALTFDALENRLVAEARITFDSGAMDLLASRIRDAILQSLPENDPAFAIPAIAPQEESRVVASWAGRKGARSEVTVGDVVDALRRINPSRRATRGPLLSQVHRLAQSEARRRLLLDEAERRGIARDWWAERQLRRIEEERMMRIAMRQIEDQGDFSASAVDSLTSLLLMVRPNLLRQPIRARVVRIDSATRGSALEERARILAAGGARARYAEILDGGALSPASYHFLSLSQGGVGPAELERAIFQQSPGTVQGPFLFGQSWVLFETIALDPERDRSPEEVRAEVSQNFREGQGAAVVEAWVQAKRKEVGVTIHEDVLDHLGPGA